MTWLLHLFTTFHGRISRKDWWIGTLILMAVGYAVSIFIEPVADHSSPSEISIRLTLGQTIWSLLMFVPSLALTIKRLNDRDHSRLLGYAWAFSGVAVIIGVYIGLFPADIAKLELSELLQLLSYLVPLVLFQSWVLIDNGFLRGTEGPNRYGPDPLDPGAGSAPSGAVPPSGRTGYSRGAFVRDALVGTVALIASAFLLVPYLTFEKTVVWLMSLYTGSDYTEMREILLVGRHKDQLDPLGNRVQDEINKQMRANKPAWEVYNKGWKAALWDKHKEAIKPFTRAIDLYGAQNKTAARVMMERGNSYRKLGEQEKALADYNAAIALRPGADDYYDDRADLYAEQKQYAKALADYDTAIRVSRTPVAHYDIRRGYMLHKLNRPEQALASYDMAIARAREKYNKLEAINRSMPNLTAAERERVLKWASERRDRSVHAGEIGRGIVLRDLKRYDQAIWAFDEAIKLNPERPYAYKQRGWVYEKRGQFAKALADYERALELKDTTSWLKKAIPRVKSKLN